MIKITRRAVHLTVVCEEALRGEHLIADMARQRDESPPALETDGGGGGGSLRRAARSRRQHTKRSMGDFLLFFFFNTTLFASKIYTSRIES